MSADSSAQPVQPDQLRQCLAEICTSQQEFQRFFADLFDELEVLWTGLLRRQQAWQAEQARSQELLTHQAAQLDRDQAALAAQRQQLWGQLEQKHAEIAAQNEQSSRQFQQALQDARREWACLRSVLETAGTEAGRLVQVAEELSETSSRLAAAREEIARLHQKLESLAAQRHQPDAEAALRQQIQEMEKQHAALRQERAALETELESVRTHAAELAEQLAGQQRQMAEERSGWAEELKRMRRLLELLSTERSEGQPAGAGQPAVEPHQLAAADDDPALASVVAQFEMLQKDIARRRKEDTKSAKKASTKSA